MELGQILNSKDEPQVEAQPSETPAPETPPAPATGRDDKGRFAKGDVKETTATPAVESEEEPLDPKAKAFYAKAKEERRKRQEAERRLEEIQRQQPPPPLPDVLENPQEYAQHLEQRVHLTTLNDRLNLSEEMVREKYGDDAIKEAQELFQQAALEDPSLSHRLVSERHPYG